MTVTGALLAWLMAGPSYGGSDVVGWRCEVVAGEGLRAGIRATELGGPYEGPAMAEGISGSLDMHWSDGRITRATLNRRAVLDPASELASWYGDAVVERDGALPPLAGPTRLPDVLTLDPAVRAAVIDDPVRMLGMLDQVRGVALSNGARRLDATLRASVSRRLVATSRNFRAVWDETTFSLDLWADEAAGASLSRRSLPSGPEIDLLARDVTHLAQQLRHPARCPDDARGVLYMPAVVDDLLARLLLPNLAGRAIRDGRSPFTREDIEQGRQILRADIDLIIDTTLPHALATAPCSPEGVPAGRASLFAAGRLVSPVVDLTTAATFGLPPTPVARGRPYAVLTSPTAPVPYDAALALLGTGVVVRDLPGLHTQAPRRGSYALVAPDAQAVVGGVAGGRCSARLRGSILDHLAHPKTRLVAVPGQPSPGLLVVDGVAITPA